MGRLPEYTLFHPLQYTVSCLVYVGKICKHCYHPTERIPHKIFEDDSIFRQCKKCKKIIVVRDISEAYTDYSDL